MLPSFSATRVSPPGSTQVFAPRHRERPKIQMSRHAARASVRVGATESPIIGWLIQLAGSATKRSPRCHRAPPGLHAARP